MADIVYSRLYEGHTTLHVPRTYNKDEQRLSSKAPLPTAIASTTLSGGEKYVGSFLKTIRPHVAAKLPHFLERQSISGVTSLKEIKRRACRTQHVQANSINCAAASQLALPRCKTKESTSKVTMITYGRLGSRVWHVVVYRAHFCSFYPHDGKRPGIEGR